MVFATVGAGVGAEVGSSVGRDDETEDDCIATTGARDVEVALWLRSAASSAATRAERSRTIWRSSFTSSGVAAVCACECSGEIRSAAEIIPQMRKFIRINCPQITKSGHHKNLT